MELHPPGQWILQWFPHMDWETSGLICPAEPPIPGVHMGT